MSSIGVGIGRDVADGKLVSFCGDHRALAAIQRLFDANSSIIAAVEDWQVTGGLCPTQGDYRED